MNARDDPFAAVLAALADCPDDEPVAVPAGTLRAMARMVANAGTVYRRAATASRRAAITFQRATDYYRRATK